MAAILIAEDDKAVREFVMRALRNDGHEVYGVGDGVQALQALETKHFDMILADIVMPQLDGIALALKVAKDFPDIPVLLMTGYVDEKQRAHNLESIVCEVMPKPFTLQEICATANRILMMHGAGRGRMH